MLPNVTTMKVSISKKTATSFGIPQKTVFLQPK
jgi:hypothetical protein